MPVTRRWFLGKEREGSGSRSGPSQRFGWKLAVPTKKAYTPNCIKHRSMNARLSNLGKYLPKEVEEVAI